MKKIGFELYKRIRAIDGRLLVCFIANDCEQQEELFLGSFPYLPAGSVAEKPGVVNDVVKIVKEIPIDNMVQRPKQKTILFYDICIFAVPN